jgi:hypothetical protein
MIAAHGLAYLLVRTALRLTLPRWLLIQLAVALAVLPWLRRYLDHGTDYPLPRYSIRFLLAIPIEYIGGNSLVLLACAMIIVVGLLGCSSGPPPLDNRLRLNLRLSHPVENLTFLTWMVLPPMLMYLYSSIAQPIFGPARYHLFVAPAYLILVAHGLTRLPAVIRWPAAAIGLVLSLALLRVYNPSPKADWRGLAAWLNQEARRSQAQPLRVVIHPSDPRFPREPLEAARYYLGPPFQVILEGQDTGSNKIGSSSTYDVHCMFQPTPSGDVGPSVHSFEGLTVDKR